jgi:Flp pilus assembly protein TadD
MGLSLLKQKQFEAAEEYLQKAVNADPVLWRSWNALGVIYDLKQQYGQSAKYYSKASGILPDSPSVANNYGYSLMMSQAYSEAEMKFRKGLEINPKDVRLRNNLGICLAWQSRYDESITEMSRIMSVWSAHNNVGYIAMLNGDYAKARAYFGSSLKLSPTYNVQAANNIVRLEQTSSSATE